MSNQIFAFLSGKPYNLSGVDGAFMHEEREARYPYPHTIERLWHVPSAAGRRSETYRQIKRQLGDDYDTDLTDSEQYVEIAVKLGYKEAL